MRDEHEITSDIECDLMVNFKRQETEREEKTRERERATNELQQQIQKDEFCDKKLLRSRRLCS